MEPIQEIERERFFSRLSTIAGVRPMPSIGAWILLQVEESSDLARKVNRRLCPGMVSVPRNVDGAVRVPVRSPKENEIVFSTIRDLMAKRLGLPVTADIEEEVVTA